MYAGLRDAFLLVGNEKARGILVRFGDWCVEVTSGLSEQQMQRMIGVEYGGMNEVMADIYTITGDKKYLDAAKRFNHHAVFERFPWPLHSDCGPHQLCHAARWRPLGKRHSGMLWMPTRR